MMHVYDYLPIRGLIGRLLYFSRSYHRMKPHSRFFRNVVTGTLVPGVSQPLCLPLRIWFRSGSTD